MYLVLKISPCDLLFSKNHLKGYAQRIISHLFISDLNFDIAVDILKKEFLDRDYIVNSIFKSISDAKVLKEYDLNSVKIFLTKLKT